MSNYYETQTNDEFSKLHTVYNEFSDQYKYHVEYNKLLSEIEHDEAFDGFRESIAKLILKRNYYPVFEKNGYLTQLVNLIRKMIIDNNCDNFDEVVNYLLSINEIDRYYDFEKVYHYLEAIYYPECLKDEDFYKLMRYITYRTEHKFYLNPLLRLLHSYELFYYITENDAARKDWLDSCFFLRTCSDVVEYIHRSQSYGDNTSMRLFYYIGENLEELKTFCKLNAKSYDSDMQFRRFLAESIINNYRSANEDCTHREIR